MSLTCRVEYNNYTKVPYKVPYSTYRLGVPEYMYCNSDVHLSAIPFPSYPHEMHWSISDLWKHQLQWQQQYHSMHMTSPQYVRALFLFFCTLQQYARALFYFVFLYVAAVRIESGPWTSDRLENEYYMKFFSSQQISAFPWLYSGERKIVILIFKASDMKKIFNKNN